MSTNKLPNALKFQKVLTFKNKMKLGFYTTDSPDKLRADLYGFQCTEFKNRTCFPLSEPKFQMQEKPLNIIN